LQFHVAAEAPGVWPPKPGGGTAAARRASVENSGQGVPSPDVKNMLKRVTFFHEDPRNGSGESPASGGGRNREADFHGQKRSNETHASTTDPEARLYREAAGYVASALVAARMFWGLLGSRYARFTQFVRPPSTVVAYVTAILLGSERRYIGHNPAGGAMILALLAAIVATATTGWLLTALSGVIAGTDPVLVLADEPTGNLDEKSARNAIALLRRLCREREKTVLLVTHDLPFAQSADRTFQLRAGVLTKAPDHAAT
jgi:cytochrome b